MAMFCKFTVFLVLLGLQSALSLTTLRQDKRKLSRAPFGGVLNAFKKPQDTKVCLCSTHDENYTHLEVPRRAFGLNLCKYIGLSALQVLVVSSAPAQAAATKTIPDEEMYKGKIVQGYQRLNYLLDNWVSETTICGRGDNPYLTGKGCERTPLKVMDYLGYRDMNDPLFRADKTMKKLEPLIPVDRFGEYLDAIEKWSEASDEGSGMAYLSSWGEANPGGGKDRVQLFIERAKKNVIDSRDSLGVIIDILDLK